MDIKKTELMLSKRDWLEHSKPIITNRIITDIENGGAITLESRTLMFFDGISLGNLNVSEDVRTYMTWKSYGKLSLRRKQSRNNDHLYKSLFSLSAVAGFGIPLYLRELYHGIHEMYDEYKGKNELIERDFDLVFNKANKIAVLKDMVVGEFKYSAKKYSSRSSQGKDKIKAFQNDTGIGTSFLELDVPFDINERPFVDIKTSYSMGEKEVDKILSIKVKNTSGYDNKTLVLYMTINPISLNPDNSKEEHTIYSVTAIKGISTPYEGRLIIPGPKYPKEDRIYGESY